MPRDISHKVSESEKYIVQAHARALLHKQITLVVSPKGSGTIGIVSADIMEAL